MRGYSLRVIPSLHSAIGDKHSFGTDIGPTPKLPMVPDAYAEGGTFAYLVRTHGMKPVTVSNI